jgi:hypothetical protein
LWHCWALLFLVKWQLPDTNQIISLEIKLVFPQFNIC